LKVAGVEGSEFERTGNACKLGACVVPHFAAPEARCYMACHFRESCACKNVSPKKGDTCKKLEEYEETEYSVRKAFHDILDL